MATAAQQQQFDPGVRPTLDESTRSDIEHRDLPDERETTIYGSARTLRKNTPRNEREKKIGHRRVDDAGKVTYKKKPTSELMTAMQLGIGQSITSLSAKPKRDLLLQDFSIVETVFFPREGSNLTPAHHYSDFRFKTYAPIAFRYFRELFGIQPDDFLLSMCNEALVELSNPGASGSIFYISADDEFIIKTVQHKEADFLQKLLPGYYMNLNQNPRTLLPKFYGLYCYQCGGKNIRFTVMNNLLPSFIKMHEKYDLKGSTYKRKASKHERSKKSPTWKDLDFMENHPEGIMLEADTYNALVKTIERDCRVLQSFKIMDYSLLMGIYNLDQAAKEKTEEEELGDAGVPDDPSDPNSPDDKGVSRGRSVRQRVAQYSTAMEAIQARADPLELNDDDIPAGGIPARNNKGERLLVYLGHIDILQSYRLKKKLEHAMKAAVIDGDTISVHRPGFYANRFQSFFREKVFKKITSLDQPQVKGPHMRFKKLVQLALKQSPSKKKPSYNRGRSVTTTDIEGRTVDTYAVKDTRRKTLPKDTDISVGGRPDLLPANATPPRMSIDSTHDQGYADNRTWSTTYSYSTMQTTTRPSLVTTSPSIPLSGEIVDPSSVGGSDIKPPSSPAYSFTESTPTHTEFTEGTPSFTTSSASVSSDLLDSTPTVYSRSGGVLHSPHSDTDNIDTHKVSHSVVSGANITSTSGDTVGMEHTSVQQHSVVSQHQQESVTMTSSGIASHEADTSTGLQHGPVTVRSSVRGSSHKPADTDVQVAN